MKNLRQRLSNKPAPPNTEPLTLPPAWLAFLSPLIQSASETHHGPTLHPSNSVTAALTQRVKLLQEENDELYNMVKHGQVGKLQEELASLRRVVGKLECALQGKRLFSWYPQDSNIRLC